MDGGEDRVDGLGLAFRARDGGLGLALGAQDRGLFLTFCLKDLRFAHALRGEDRGALIALGAKLLFHGVLDRGRRVDRLKLNAVDANTPTAGRFIEDAAQLRVDRITARERRFQVEGADDVTQSCDSELFDGLDEVGDLVGRIHRVGDLVVDDRVNGDDNVIRCDDGLGLEARHLLAKVHSRGDAVDEGDEDVQAAVHDAVELSEAFNDEGSGLGDDLDCPYKSDDD